MLLFWVFILERSEDKFLRLTVSIGFPQIMINLSDKVSELPKQFNELEEQVKLLKEQVNLLKNRIAKLEGKNK